MAENDVDADKEVTAFSIPWHYECRRIRTVNLQIG